MNETESLKKFLVSHPLISRRGLEEMTEMYRGTIYNVITGRNKFTTVQQINLIEVLKDYGYRQLKTKQPK